MLSTPWQKYEEQEKLGTPQKLIEWISAVFGSDAPHCVCVFMFVF